jgi:hypothetical protein
MQRCLHILVDIILLLFSQREQNYQPLIVMQQTMFFKNQVGLQCSVAIGC